MGVVQCRRRNSATPPSSVVAATRASGRVSATRRDRRIASPYQDKRHGSLRSVARIPVPVVTIGWRAQAALAGRGAMRPLGALSKSAYLTVGGELIWLGEVGAGLHARAVLVPRVPDGLDGLTLDQSRARVWRPPTVRGAEFSRLATNCRAVCQAL